MALTTTAWLQSALGLTTLNEDQLDVLRESAEALVRSYCHRDFESASRTEYLQGNGRKELVLSHKPVTSITGTGEGCWIDWFGNFGTNPDGAFAASSKLVHGTDYQLWLDGTIATNQVSFCGILVRNVNVWPEIQRQWYPTKISPEVGPAPGTIKVVYTAGYPEVPRDVQLAVAQIVSALRRNLPVGGELETERIGDYSYGLFYPHRGGDIMPEIGAARQLLSTYRECVL